MLQRGYFSFLVTLVNNNVLEVLSNQGELFDAGSIRFVLALSEKLIELNLHTTKD